MDCAFCAGTVVLVPTDCLLASRDVDCSVQFSSERELIAECSASDSEEGNAAVMQMSRNLERTGRLRFDHVVVAVGDSARASMVARGGAPVYPVAGASLARCEAVSSRTVRRSCRNVRCPKYAAQQCSKGCCATCCAGSSGTCAGHGTGM